MPTATEPLTSEHSYLYRENRVLSLYAQGLSDEEISARTTLPLVTVQTIIANPIQEK